MRTVGMLFACLALLLSPALSSGARAEDDAAAQVVRAFHASWKEGNVDALLKHLSDDCYYENIPPVGPAGGMKGKAKIRAFLADVFDKDALTVPYSLTAEIKQVFVSGDAVIVERTDNFAIGQTHIALPVLAEFRVKDGKITVWRDYFDGETLKPALYLMAALKRPK